MKNRHAILSIIVTTLLITVQVASAQNEERITRTEITNTKLIGFGVSQILDTYISQEHYNGTEIRFIDHTERRKASVTTKYDDIALSPIYRKWSASITHKAFISSTTPRSDDNKNLAGLYTLGIGRQRHWDLLANKLHLKAGIAGQADIGFLYNTRNGNNPGQIRLGINILPHADAGYDFEAFGKRFTVDYKIQIPLAGLMFTPHYGQSYYEIFTRGNYDHNIVVTTPFNAPSMQHSLQMRLHLKHMSITLGYLGDYQQAKVNNLKYHNYSHLVVVGLTRRFHIVKTLTE